MPEQKDAKEPSRKTYGKRTDDVANPVGKRLLQIMGEKESNLCVAADVSTKSALLALAEEVNISPESQRQGPHSFNSCFRFYEHRWARRSAS
mmetsp:Transcript_35812/g.143120  ORF Transcript_35812/g.143120 Transcript_35812/m.143120 type:complete len:92 (-) Transcript_35812:1607-1882(-)